MTWLETLAAELSARGVPGPERTRIRLELSDHIECEPGCEDRLGDPGQLAASFANELATDRVRGSAFGTFAALTAAAFALIISQLAIGPAGGYPGFANGISIVMFFPALVGMVVAPQIALVTGILAAWRAVRRRRALRLPAAEIALIGRRARVALLAGFGTVAGLELYLVNFSLRFPLWYVGLVGSLAAVAGAALWVAYRNLTRARALVSDTAGEAGDVYDDLPILGWSRLRRRPWLLGVIGAVMVGVVMTIFEAHAERSLVEGIQRGLLEGLAAAIGFAVLGRAVGLHSGSGEEPQLAGFQLAGPGIRAGLIGGPTEQLAGDEDRARAELILRESFADGRIAVDELTRRVAAIHDAKTVGALRDALRGLPI